MKFKFFMSVFIVVFFASCSLFSTPKPRKNQQIGRVIQSDLEQEKVGFSGVDSSNLSLAKNIDSYIGTRVGGDCSGFVSVINKNFNNIYFDPRKLPKFFGGIGTKSQAIYNYFAAKGKISFNEPRVGDLIFFSNTTHKTRHKKAVNAITHVGIVREIYAAGHVRFVHFASGRDMSDYMNLNRPNVHKDGKRIENSYISRCKMAVHCLASNKFAGYGKMR